MTPPLSRLVVAGVRYEVDLRWALETPARYIEVVISRPGHKALIVFHLTPDELARLLLKSLDAEISQLEVT